MRAAAGMPTSTDQGAYFDGLYRLKEEQRRVCGTGTQEAYLAVAQATLSLTGEMTRT